MLTVGEQIAQGRLVCPRTRQRLRVEEGCLVSEDGAHRYRFEDGVPRMIPDARRAESYQREADGSMVDEYAGRAGRPRLLRFVDRLLATGGEVRSSASRRAFEAVARRGAGGGLCLSVGGGPRRIDSRLVNLNVDAFDNVDVVGDAYALPYADASVDAIHCEAVLEHLEAPDLAVREMFRVLVPDGEVFAATPFLQAFHAYPSHFQNFTQVGHDRLFRRHGFEVVSSGACVGPTFALTDLASLYLRHYLPGRRTRRAAGKLFALLTLPLRHLDRRLVERPDAHLLASTVYSHLVKP
jgi:SAM-dependent methyltransferase